MLTVLLCVAYGLVLATSSADDHFLSGASRNAAISLPVGVMAAAVLALWARTLMPEGVIAIIFGLGGILQASDQGGTFGYLWKYSYSVPVTLVVLGAACLYGKVMVQISALAMLGAVTMLADARSLFAMYIVAAGMLLWSAFTQGRRSASSTRVAMVLALLFAVYKVTDILVTHGVLGEQAQQRSLNEASVSGSTLLGGRPELSATVALMREHPAGFGVGILPNTRDVAIGNTALERLGFQPMQDGFSQYMFGRQQYELHSIFGDLWVNFGVVGLIAAALLTGLVLTVLSLKWTNGPSSALILFLAASTGWNIISSPLWSAEPALIIFIGLALPWASGHPVTLQRGRANNLSGWNARWPSALNSHRGLRLGR